MTPAEFDYIRGLLKDSSGLVLAEEKRYLLESRLAPVLRDNDLESLGALVAVLRAPGSEALRDKVTQAMTINESFFFRDKTPFENFTGIMLPEFMNSPRAANRQLRIWCAAASTGQEPYSLAILLKEMEAELRGWNIEIIGTDICEEVLEKAKAGLYSQFEVQRGLPIQLLVKYFQQTGSMWQIDSTIRSMVTYKHFNLLNDYAALGTFDIVFCRNVLIYFDPPTKSDILSRMSRRMRPGGYLVLGAAETVIGISEDYKPVPEARGLYSLPDATQGMAASLRSAATALGGGTAAAGKDAATPVAPPAASSIKLG